MVQITMETFANKDEAIDFINGNVDLEADKIVVAKTNDGLKGEATYPDP